MNRIVCIIICLCAVFACTERRDYRDVLAHAHDIMEEYPDSALAILDTLGRHEKEFSRHFRMQYLLYLTQAQAKTGVLFTTDSLTSELAKHFDDSGTCTEKALAYYLDGCAKSDIGQAPEALQAFQDAIEKTDTAKNEYDFQILRVIYGQMSRIFDKQNLPQDEIWALERYIYYTRKTSDEEAYIWAKSQMVRPYCLLQENDSVLKIANEAYQSFLQLGKKEKASSALAVTIYIYLERNQMDEAKRAIELFENESDAFDKEGNIEPGREGYYHIKGFYELANKNIDAAERNFRKAISYGYRSEGYRGLLNVYREKNVIDSVVLFSELYEAAQDSLHNKMQIETIHQMSSLYNYNRSQKEAQAERDRATRTRWISAIVLIAAVLTVAGLSLLYRSNIKKRKRRIQRLEHELGSAIASRSEIMEELQHLKDKDYESVIAAKEEKLASLTETIALLQAENKTYKEGTMFMSTENLEQFLDSDIAAQFISRATDMSERVLPTEVEWTSLISRFRSTNPLAYMTFTTGKGLTKSEMRTCILLILDIPENIIALMTNTTTSAISNQKARANEKLFGKKEAHPLKNNLITALKTSW